MRRKLEPEEPRPFRTESFTFEEQFLSAVLIVITRGDEYLYVGASETPLTFLLRRPFYQSTAMAGAKTTMYFFDDKETAYRERNKILARYNPVYNGKVGRRGEAEKRETGLSFLEKTKEDINADKLINEVLGKQSDKKKESKVDEILGMDLDELLKDLDLD